MDENESNVHYQIESIRSIYSDDLSLLDHTDEIDDVPPLVNDVPLHH